MNITEIEEILRPVEEVLLDGENFPKGRFWSSERDKEIESISPKIVEVYEIIQNSEEKIPGELWNRIFYFARSIRKNFSQIPYFSQLPYLYTEVHIEDENLSERLREIANEGRKLSLASPKTIKRRIKLAKLYSDGLCILASQLRDPKRGCSASVCTNCDEPIAFNYSICDICGYELIDAHNMPTVSEWSKMNLSTRLESFQKGYDSMITDIHQRGDWRGNRSTKKSKYNFYK